MRLNLPVTDQEFSIPAGVALVSCTDLQGRIVHANATFVTVSGYSRDELMGQPHNLLRHPDMPAEGYRDLWDTIQRGRPWSGVVKNRRKKRRPLLGTGQCLAAAAGRAAGSLCVGAHGAHARAGGGCVGAVRAHARRNP